MIPYVTPSVVTMKTNNNIRSTTSATCCHSYLMALRRSSSASRISFISIVWLMRLSTRRNCRSKLSDTAPSPLDVPARPSRMLKRLVGGRPPFSGRLLWNVSLSIPSAGRKSCGHERHIETWFVPSCNQTKV